MDFNKMLKPASKKSVFRDEKYFVWCGTTVRGDDGLYYFYYSRWPRQYGHQGWVIASEVAYAYSDSPLGPFVPKGVALAGSGKKDGWDRDCIIIRRSKSLMANIIYITWATMEMENIGIIVTTKE